MYISCSDNKMSDVTNNWIQLGDSFYDKVINELNVRTEIQEGGGESFLMLPPGHP